MSKEGAPENPGEIVANLLVTNLEGKTIEELEAIKVQVKSAFYEDMPATDASALSSMEEEIDDLITKQKKQEVTESKEELPENLREIKTELDSRKEKRRSQRAKGEEIKQEILQRIGGTNPEFMSSTELEEYRGWLKTQLKWKGLDREVELNKKIQKEIETVDGYLREKEKQAQTPAFDTRNQENESGTSEKEPQDEREEEVSGRVEDGPDLNTGEIPAEIVDDVLPEEVTQEERQETEGFFRKNWSKVKGRVMGISYKEVLKNAAVGGAVSAAVKIGARAAFGMSGGVLLGATAGSASAMARREWRARNRRLAFERGQRDVAENSAHLIELVKKGKLHKLDAVQILERRSVEIGKMVVEDEYDEALKMNAEFDADKVTASIFENLDEIENLPGIEKLGRYLEIAEKVEGENEEVAARRGELEKEIALITGRKISKKELGEAALTGALAGAIGGAVGHFIGEKIVEHFHITGLHLPLWLGGHGTGQAVHPTTVPKAGAPIKSLLTDTSHVASHDSMPGARGAGSIDSLKAHPDSTPKVPTGTAKTPGVEHVGKGSMPTQPEVAPAEPTTPRVSEAVPQAEAPKIDMSRFKIGVTAHEVEVTQPELHELTMAEATAPEVMKSIDAEHIQVGELLNKLADANVPSGPELDAAYTLHDLHPTAEDMHKTVAEYLHDRLAPDSITSGQLEEMSGVQLQGVETLHVPHHAAAVGVESHDVVSQTPSASSVAPAPTHATPEPVYYSSDFKGPAQAATSYASHMGEISPLSSSPLSQKSPFVEAMVDTRSGIGEHITKAEKSFINWVIVGKTVAAAGAVGAITAGAVYARKRLNKHDDEVAKQEEVERIIKENSADRIKHATTPQEIRALTSEEKRAKIMSLLPPKGGFIFGRNNEVREVESLLDTKKPRDLFNALYRVAEQHPNKIEDIRKAGEVAFSLHPGAMGEFDRLRAQLDALEESIKEDTSSTS